MTDFEKWWSEANLQITDRKECARYAYVTAIAAERAKLAPVIEAINAAYRTTFDHRGFRSLVTDSEAAEAVFTAARNAGLLDAKEG